MKFKSKTQLIEHIKELVKNGYLTEHWEFENETHTKASKIYKINFGAVKDE